MIPIKITVSNSASLPAYHSAGAAGCDVCACLEQSLEIKPGGVALIPTGLCIEIPGGYEAQIRPRSGLALRHGITLLNSPGTIDADYRGEIKIIAANLGSETFVVEHGMRIAQMVFCKVYRGHFIIEKKLNQTDRDNGGFGHTGL